MTTEFLTGAVKCPGELPREYPFCTEANLRTELNRIKEKLTAMEDE